MNTIKKILNIFSLLICCVIILSCKKHTFENNNRAVKGVEFSNDLKLFDTIKIVKDSTRLYCGSGIYISDKIEKNTDTKELLKKYISKCLLENDYCKEINYNPLFKHPSFEKTVIYIYTSNDFLKNNIFEDESRWKENYLNLLIHCTDQNVLLSLCDELLRRGIDDGIVALFDKEKVNLKYIHNYIVSNSDNFYKLSLLAIYFKNTSDEKSLNEILKYINNLSPKSYDVESKNNLFELLKKEDKIEYEEYIEAIYGGY